MKEHNLEAFYKYYSNATKEQAIEDMFLDNCNLQEEIERLNNIINKAIEYMNEVLECNYHGGNVTFDALVHNTEHILRGSDKE